jgi:hypothetical protein
VRCLLSEADDDRARRLVLDHAQDQVRGAQQRVDRAAVRALDRRGQGKEGAEEDRVAVDYEQRSDGPYEIRSVGAGASGYD